MEKLVSSLGIYLSTAWNDAIYYVSSLVVAVSVLGIHVGALGGTLTPGIVFTSFTLWNLLQYSVTKHIPHAIMGLSECYVTCQRIQSFLELPEQASITQTPRNNQQTLPLIELTEATSYWDPSQETPSMALENISLQFQPNSTNSTRGSCKTRKKGGANY